MREVFTPSLAPENGDLVGQHMLRAPVLVAESADVGVVLAVDIDLLRKSRGIPAGLSLLRKSDNEVDLIVGLRAQERRGHVFHKERRATGHLDVDTISHRYHIGLFPNPERGGSLKAARRKIWLLGAEGPGHRHPGTVGVRIRSPDLPRRSRPFVEGDGPGRKAGRGYHYEPVL